MRRFGGGAVAVRGSSDSGMVRRRRAASVLFSALAVCAIHAQNDARCHAAIRCHQALSLPPPLPPLKSVLKIRTSASIQEGLTCNRFYNFDFQTFCSYSTMQISWKPNFKTVFSRHGCRRCRRSRRQRQTEPPPCCSGFGAARHVDGGDGGGDGAL